MPHPEFFPGKIAIKAITQDGIEFTADRLKHHPRKSISFKTPHEVVFKMKLESRHNAVAPQARIHLCLVSRLLKIVGLKRPIMNTNEESTKGILS